MVNWHCNLNFRRFHSISGAILIAMMKMHIKLYARLFYFILQFEAKTKNVFTLISIFATKKIKVEWRKTSIRLENCFEMKWKIKKYFIKDCHWLTTSKLFQNCQHLISNEANETRTKNSLWWTKMPILILPQWLLSIQFNIRAVILLFIKLFFFKFVKHFSFVAPAKFAIRML